MSTWSSISFQICWWTLPRARVKRDHLVVIVWHSVDTATVCSDWSRSHYRHQNFLPLVRQLEDQHTHQRFKDKTLVSVMTDLSIKQRDVSVQSYGLNSVGGQGYTWLTAAYLRLVADEDVVLHWMRDVVDRELQEGPFWDVDQANTCPGGTAVQRVRPGDHSHSLKTQHEHTKSIEIAHLFRFYTEIWKELWNMKQEETWN